MHAKFGVTFPILDKVKVNGPEESPLFSFLKSKQGGSLSSLLGTGISWNFTKFLCCNGIPIARYSPAASPSSMEKSIQALLGEKKEVTPTKSSNYLKNLLFLTEKKIHHDEESEAHNSLSKSE